MTRCCSRARGTRSRSISTTARCSSSTTRSWCGARWRRWGRAAGAAIVVLAVLVVLLAAGLVPPVVAGLLAAGAMILWACSPAAGVPGRLVADGRPRGGHDPALDGDEQTGAAEAVADRLVESSVGTGSPLPAAPGAACSPRSSGSLSATPRPRWSSSRSRCRPRPDAGVSARPFLMAVAVAAAAPSSRRSRRPPT